MPRPVTREEFERVLEDVPASPAFFEHLARFASFGPLIEIDAMVHEGDLRLKGSYRAPALCSLFVGNLEVEDVLDLESRFDQGGLFIVIGSLTCKQLIGDYSLSTIIDGDLTAQDAVITGFSDSDLSVMGTLRTRLFVGCDIPGNVGAGAEVDYGVGHCMPIGEYGAAPIAPRNSEAATAKIVVPKGKPEGYLFEAEQFAELIRAGKPIFR